MYVHNLEKLILFREAGCTQLSSRRERFTQTLLFREFINLLIHGVCKTKSCKRSFRRMYICFFCMYLCPLICRPRLTRRRRCWMWSGWLADGTRIPLSRSTRICCRSTRWKRMASRSLAWMCTQRDTAWSRRASLQYSVGRWGRCVNGQRGTVGGLQILQGESAKVSCWLVCKTGERQWAWRFRGFLAWHYGVKRSGFVWLYYIKGVWSLLVSFGCLRRSLSI